jgi:hypothetical protein
MAGLRKYVEWMSRGRRTDRVAYVLKERDLPDPLPGAEWQQDVKFNPAEEVLANPDLRDVFSEVIATGPPSSSKSHWLPDLRTSPTFARHVTPRAIVLPHARQALVGCRRVLNVETCVDCFPAR